MAILRQAFTLSPDFLVTTPPCLNRVLSTTLLKPAHHPGFWSKNLETFGQKQNLWVKLNYKVFCIALVLKFKLDFDPRFLSAGFFGKNKSLN